MFQFRKACVGLDEATHVGVLKITTKEANLIRAQVGQSDGFDNGCEWWDLMVEREEVAPLAKLVINRWGEATISARPSALPAVCAAIEYLIRMHDWMWAGKAA